MYRIVLAEDDPRDESLIRDLCNRFFAERGERCELLTFEDGDQLLEARPADVDLFLLDIEMPRVDGLTVAKRIRAADPDVAICFLTSLGQLAPDGYSVDALGFMIKPVSYEMFRRTLAHAIERIERRRARLVSFKEGKGERFVDIHAIAYIESRSKKTIVHTVDGEFPCSETLKAIEARLSIEGLFRVHHAFLVNLDHIEAVTASDVVIQGTAIPVSKHRKAQFLQALAVYIGKRL